MARDLASILKINKLTPIPEKDRIEVATVENWEVIVKKGEFKEGDLCVYIEYDTLLPIRPEFEFLRKSCYNSKYNRFRIRNMKMAGIFSQGIVFPLSILPPESNKDSVYKEGLVVADLLDIKKYDSEEPKVDIPKSKNKLHNFLMKNKVYKKAYLKLIGVGNRKYPSTIKESDETNIQKVFNRLKEKYPDEHYYKTEKLEGQAATFCLKYKDGLLGKLFKIREYSIYSHHVKMKKGDNSNWDIISKKYSIEEGLRDLTKNYTVQGEIVGPGIQRNIYKLDELKFFVYSITESETGKVLNFSNMNTLLIYRLEFNVVPLIEIDQKLPETVKEVIEDSNGKSVFYDGLREGIVWRSMMNPNISFKAKSPDYAVWWENGDK